MQSEPQKVAVHSAPWRTTTPSHTMAHGGVGKDDLDLLVLGAKRVPTHTMMTTTGWLGKKGGGEAADAGSLKNMIRKKVEPWNARFFVLPAGGRTIRWYDSAEDAEAGMTEKGSMDIPVGQTRRPALRGAGSVVPAR